MTKEEEKTGVTENRKGQAFAGSASCAGCHKDLYQKHLQTAHFLTSREPQASYIKGNTDPEHNKYFYNQSVVVAVEKRTDGYYQVEYFREAEKKARRMDLVIGSGTMGQSFLNWQDQKLFQLPITYFTAANQWSNSPGFPDKVVFNRVITSRCLECHTSFMKIVSEPGTEPESFDRNRMILGVDCEKCHGPAAAHVAWQTQHPNDTMAREIINPGRFTRQQSLDLCASCHGGRLQKLTPSFSFTAGDALKDHFIVDTTAPDPSHIDVHGNQYGLLRASPCFRNSLTMTCTTCHNPHEKEKGNVTLFSARCKTCHQEVHVNSKQRNELALVGKDNCIDCHMPLKASRAIAVQLEGNAAPVSALIRSHYISIYPDETQKILQQFRERTVKKK
ncbi:MAG TPA: multiheme c-type cytochrome [Flavisolibacter sp.]|nr:multiheme c-type cytochrome [Flavisolibacter sp.]